MPRKPKGRKPGARPGAAKDAGKGVKRKASGADTSGGATAGGFELGELRQLIRLVQRTGIGELEISSGGRSVRISANAGSAMTWVAPPPGTTGSRAAAPETPETGAGAPAAGAAAPAADRLKAITSPMVGTFYRAPAPDADPYAEVGDVIEVGQTVCIIEAMKLMNEIESEIKGRVVQMLVENAQPVEFGQKLFLVEPV